jgi:hypothetical protein
LRSRSHRQSEWSDSDVLGCAGTWAVSVYPAYQRTWKPFNPILGETYEMVNHNGVTFLAEQVSNDFELFSLKGFLANLNTFEIIFY